MRICIPCHDFVFAGGFFRFIRFGREAGTRGHRVAFVRLADDAIPVDLDMLSFEEAAVLRWDATMVPGAAFPASTIERLAAFRRPGFGLRVQHVLNGPRRKPGFLAVNARFAPDVVVVNNRHWPPEELAELRGVCRVLEGAVDTIWFRPGAARPPGRPFRIGGLSHKNPAPLLAAARALGDVEVRLFGRPAGLERIAADLIAARRLQLLGTLEEDRLPGFYRGLDCVVHTEPFAGWANLGAEALASGVPLICTPHGTLAFATHEETALVVDPATGPAIAAAITRLRDDPALAARLGRAGRARIAGFTWESYATGLLGLLAGHAVPAEP